MCAGVCAEAAARPVVGTSVQIDVYVRVSWSPAKAVGTATISVQTKKAIKSKKAKANVPANGKKKLKFKFKSKALKTIKKAIAKKGKNPKAKLTVTLTDKAGNKAKLKKNVKLKN